MLRLILGGVVGGLFGLAALGRYKEIHDLDYCAPARRLRWIVFKAEMKERRKRKNGNAKITLPEKGG